MTALPMATFCPATMCVYFAKDGSPWTGETNAKCDGDKCGWWFDGGCVAGTYSLIEVNSERPDRKPLPKPHCPRESECQWQNQLGEQVCPPRAAIMRGVNPALAAY